MPRKKPPPAAPTTKQANIVQFFSPTKAASTTTKAEDESLPTNKKRRRESDENDDVLPATKRKKQQEEPKSTKAAPKQKRLKKRTDDDSQEDDSDEYKPEIEDEKSNDGIIEFEELKFHGSAPTPTKTKTIYKSRRRSIEDSDEEEAESKQPSTTNTKPSSSTNALSSLSPEELKAHIESQPVDLKTRKKFEAKLKDREEYIQRHKQSQVAAEDEEGEDIEEEVEEKPKSKQTKLAPGSKPKYTPMEQQFLEIKKHHPDTILFVEAGYRYRFFGKDAEIAAKVLNIVANVNHNFLSTSIPIHRLYVHARRLVQAGYKVGVVRQTETAGLRAAGGKKAGPFSRALTEMYTKATLVGDMDPLEAEDSQIGVYLMCIIEQPHSSDNSRVNIAIAAIKASTGEIIYDSFDDTLMRTELDTRLRHINPIELLLPTQLSEPTSKLIDYFVNSRREVATSQAESVRIERMESDKYEEEAAKQSLLNAVSTSFESTEDKEQTRLFLESLPDIVRTCLGCLTTYLEDFGLHNLFAIKCNYRSFTCAQYMRLDANAITNLELLRNQTDGGYRGSLVWVLDHCRTPFGRRQLINWVKAPLISKKLIEERLDAVEEIMQAPDNSELKQVINALLSLPDLERGIARIYYQRCSFDEFVTVLKSFKKISKAIPKPNDLKRHIKSELLQRLLLSIPPTLADEMNTFLERLNKDEKNPSKQNYFNPQQLHAFPKVKACQQKIFEVEDELQKHLKELRKLLKIPELEYVTRNNIEYVIELKKEQSKRLPSEPFEFHRVSSTKALDRYQTNVIQEQFALLTQYRDMLSVECDNAWNEMLREFSKNYVTLRNVVSSLAVLDCLTSLSVVAKQEGYCKPVISTQHEITIVNGRHPIIESLLSEPFVPNDTHMGEKYNHTCSILTGPNMGGKSTAARQVALIVIMAQVGSFVPAESAQITPLEAIHTRMGASDNEARGHSTFFVELQETSDILAQAKPNTLVILDELGRGTSTYDGFAIAYATLHYILSHINCFTLFITHYPGLSQLEKLFPNRVRNYYMGFRLLDDKDSTNNEQEPAGVPQRITFLYKLVRGVEPKSYGLNVARLAHLPPEVLQTAQKNSHKLEMEVRHRTLKSSIRMLANTLRDMLDGNAQIDQQRLTELSAQFNSLLELRR